MRIEIKFALISLAMGAAIGFLGQYVENLGLLAHGPENNIEWRAVNVASVLVLYPVTLFVFYALGKTKVHKFRTGLLTIVTFASGLGGQFVGEIGIRLLPIGEVGFRIPSFPYDLFVNLIPAFTFLFVALSGVAFARLRSGESPLPSASRKTSIAIVLIALGFFFAPSFWNGYFFLGFSNTLASSSLLAYIDLAVLALPILRFLIFYYAARKVSIVGRPFRYFGLLFFGAYVGAILGAVVSVALYGQSQWSLQPYAIGSPSGEYGIIFRNIAQSPLLILESLIPVQSLPFLAFFAMSVSRLGGSGSSQQTSVPVTPYQDGNLEYVGPSAMN